MGRGGGGGGQKIICANAHYEREIRSPFRQGSRARLKGLEALGVLMLSSAIWALCFKHSDTKWVIKKSQSISFGGGGGGGAQQAPPWIRHCYWHKKNTVLCYVFRNVWHFVLATISPVINANAKYNPRFNPTQNQNPLITLTLTLCCRIYYRRSNCRRSKCRITAIYV